nr:patatin-like phospholipase family protein [Lysobacter sp. CAU 1642]
MLQIQAARTRQPSSRRIGLAIAGGGPIGGMYELGTLRALEEAIEGLDLTSLDVYVGVSSGAFLASGLANRMDTAAMTRVFITGDRDDAQFHPDAFVRPAFWEYARRALSFPRHLVRWWRDILLDPGSANLNAALSRLGALVPAGLFDNDEIGRFLADAFSRHGRTNDFRELRRKLRVVAVDLDNGEAVRFGEHGWDDVPISRAVQASAALPGLYPPVPIRNRQFVDGALRRTMHASIALEEGVDLLIGLNPLVPFDASMARAHGKHPESLVEGGLPVVLSQTFRTLLQSRVQVGMAKYAHQYREVDQLLLEPNPDDAEMFFTSVFSYKSRRRVCDHAYRATLSDLRARRAQLAPILARHGLRFRDEVLDDEQRGAFDSLTQQRRRHTNTTARLRRALDDVETLVSSRQRGRRRRMRG